MADVAKVGVTVKMTEKALKVGEENSVLISDYTVGETYVIEKITVETDTQEQVRVSCDRLGIEGWWFPASAFGLEMPPLVELPLPAPAPRYNERLEAAKERLRQRIENDYTFHPPRNKDDIQKHEDIRESGKRLALLLVDIVPPGRELSLALTKLEEVTMHANAALARNR